MGVSRRDVLKVLGGGLVGTVFSPVPWHLLRDSALWTQNWPWVPVPARGPTTTAYSACTLCPAACGVRVRCVGDRPVMLAGLPEDPAERGALCAAGLAAHQMPWHPDRVRSVLRRSAPGEGGFTPSTLEEAVTALATSIRNTDRGVAFLDGRPGRVVSGAWRELMAGLPRGQVLALPSRARSSMSILRSLLASDPGPLAVDLSAVGTLVGFSAPLLDGWGRPGLVHRFLEAGHLRLVQFEAVQSRTALRADPWVPVVPGTEGVVALGLVRVLLQSGRVDPAVSGPGLDSLRDACEPWTPRHVREVAGVPEATLALVAERMEPGRTLVIGGGDPGGGPLPRGDEASVQALNLLLGALGRTVRPQAPVEGDPATFGGGPPLKDLAEVEDGSLGVLILDLAMAGAAIPWPLVATKLAPGALVVALTPVLDETAEKATWVLPTAPVFTGETDCPGHPDFPQTLRLARRFSPAGPEVVDPVDLLNRIGTALGVERTRTSAPDLPSLVMQKVQALHRAGGTVQMPGQPPVALSEVASPDELLDLLRRGGCWRGPFAGSPGSGTLEGPGQESGPEETPSPGTPSCEIAAGAGDWATAPVMDPAFPLRLVLEGSIERTSRASRAPLLSRVDQESGLRPRPGTVRMNPATMAGNGLVGGRPYEVSTAGGSLQVQIQADPGVPPGTLVASAAPRGRRPWTGGNPLDLLPPGWTTWRRIPARIRETT